MKVKRSLSQKIAWAVIAIGSLVLVTIGFAFYRTSAAALKQRVLQQAQNEAALHVKSFENIFSASESIANSIAVRQMSRGEATQPDDEAFFAELLNQSPKAFVFGVYFVPEHIPWNDPRCGTYVTRSTYPQKAPATYDHQDPEQDWYWVPKTTLKPHITGSYYDSDASITMVSFTRPVVAADGTLMGVSGVDVSLTTIQELTNSLKVELDGVNTDEQSAILIDANGDLIAHPDTGLLAGKEKDAAPFKKLDIAAAVNLKSDSGASHFGSNFLVWSKSTTTGWTTVLLIPESHIFAQVTPLRNQILGLSLAGLLALGIITAWLTRRLFRPLKDFAQSAKLMVQGDCSVRFPVTSNDEVGQLATILNEVAEHNSKVAEVAIALADGNLTLRPQSKGALDSVGNSMARIVDSWTEYVTGLKSNTVRLDDSIRTLDSSLTRFQNVSSDIENKVDISRNSVEGLLVTGESIADSNRALEHSISQLRRVFCEVLSVVEASGTGAGLQIELSAETRNKIDRVSTDLDSLQATMRTTLEQAGKSLDQVEALAQKESAIREITKTLTAISEQTRLLALNASIEAARAGQAGLGFAVVAKEVSGLAERSAEATRHVDEILSEIGSDIVDVQGQIKATAELIHQSDEATSAGCTTMRDVWEAIDQVEYCAKQNADNMQSIGKLTSSVDSALDEISRQGQKTVEDADTIVDQSQSVCSNIESIKDATFELVDASGGLRAVAGDVHSSSQTLKLISAQFVVTDNPEDGVSSAAA